MYRYSRSIILFCGRDSLYGNWDTVMIFKNVLGLVNVTNPY